MVNIDGYFVSWCSILVTGIRRSVWGNPGGALRLLPTGNRLICKPVLVDLMQIRNNPKMCCGRVYIISSSSLRICCFCLFRIPWPLCIMDIAGWWSIRWRKWPFGLTGQLFGIAVMDCYLWCPLWQQLKHLGALENSHASPSASGASWIKQPHRHAISFPVWDRLLGQAWEYSKTSAARSAVEW